MSKDALVEAEADPDHTKLLIGQVEAVSKSFSALALGVIAACFFSLLTCGTFSDVQMVSKAAVTAIIPGVGLSLPVQHFLQWAPWILLTLHLYFLVTLDSYERLVLDLDAEYGNVDPPLCAKACPSLFNSLVPELDRNSFRSERGLLHLERPLAMTLIYLLIPFSILVIWFRALALHGMFLHLPLFTIFAFVISALLSIIRYTRHRRVRSRFLRPANWVWWKVLCLEVLWAFPLILLGLGFYWFADFSFREQYPRFASAALVVFCAFLFHVVSCFNKSSAAAAATRRRIWCLATLSLYVFCAVLITRQAYIGTFTESRGNWLNRAVFYFETARVSDADLSQKPVNWDGGSTDAMLRNVKGALLRHQNLRYMAAFQLFAVNSQMDQSDLTGADLTQADLRGANIINSHLDNAMLQDAKLSGAFLSYSSLNGAHFGGADLSGADLNGADLSGANLQGTIVTFEQLRAAARMDDRTKVDVSLELSKCRIAGSEDMSVWLSRGSQDRRVWRVPPPVGVTVEAQSKWKGRQSALAPCQ